MKKLVLLGLVATLFTLGASAQTFRDDVRKPHDRSFDAGSLTRGEKMDMRHDHGRYEKARHRAHRDGKFSRHEKKKLWKMKKHNRKQAYRYHHNDRRRY